MRGLLKAGVLLAPALAGAVVLEEDSIPSAFITLHLPESADATVIPDLVLRFDIHESTDACGYGNVTINGQNFPEGGRGSLPLDDGRVVEATWNFTCVTWNNEPQEQLLSLDVETIHGQPVEDVGFTIRFQQVAPVWISDIEGSASMTRVHSIGQSQHHGHEDREIDLGVELAELDFLRWRVAELHHIIYEKEHRLAKAFGRGHRGPGPHGHGHIKDCDSLKCVIGALVHKVRCVALSFYGVDGARPSSHGPRPHGHHLEGKHHHRPFGSGPPPPPPPELPHSGHHGNHTNNGPHPLPSPGKKPHFGHPPPFCKCAPPPPPPPPGHEPEHPFPPPPPPPFPHGAHHRGPPPHHRGPGIWESLFGGFDEHHGHEHHGHRPPYPPPTPWGHPDFDDHHKGPGHQPPAPWDHEGKPNQNSYKGHGEPADEFEHDSKEQNGEPHHDGHKPTDKFEHTEPEGHIPPEQGWKPHHEGHDGQKPSEDMNQPGHPEAEAEKQVDEDVVDFRPEGQPKKAEEPEQPKNIPDDDPWESELRRDHDHGPMHGPHHEGPQHHEHHPPSFPMDGPHDHPHSHDGPGPHRPGPHGPRFIHIASAIASIVILGVFISVLYQRYVRKSIYTHRRRYSNAPWYKKLCFGPYYHEISEEKVAILGDHDYDSDDEEGDGGVVARDISQFRTATDVVNDMVAVEEGRMICHSRQASQEAMLMPVAPMAQQQQVQQTYVPVPIPAAQVASIPDLNLAAAMFGGDLQDDHEIVVDELPAYQEADRSTDSDNASELASSLAADGYRPGMGGSYTPSESGSLGASDILGDTKN